MIDIALRELEEWSGQAFPRDWFTGRHDPLLIVNRLKQWLEPRGNVSLILQSFLDAPVLGKGFFAMLEGSAFFSKQLTQFPELGYALSEGSGLQGQVSKRLFLEQGRQFLRGAEREDQKKDCLRQLKQFATAELMLRDFCDLDPQPQIWRGISDLAEAILELSMEVFWPCFAAEKGLDENSRPSIIAFGKLGGHELNLSSDIDLVFLISDEASEEEERIVSRYVQQLTRNLEQEMGRGRLYRVDLRLRPFGRSGNVVSRWRDIEAYYDLYAETWEHLALIRSRAVYGENARWESLRSRVCWQTQRGAWQVEELLLQRDRMEGMADPNDLKKGPGGIRDIEFPVQILQLLQGTKFAPLRGRALPETVEELGRLNIVPEETCRLWSESYTLLRRLEHRIQWMEDRHTHTLPTQLSEVAILASGLNLGSPEELNREVQQTREAVRAALDQFQSGFGPNSPTFKSSFPEVEELLRKHPQGAELRRALQENQGSLPRLARALRDAPAILSASGMGMEILEPLLSGELLDPGEPIAEASAFYIEWIRWGLEPEVPPHLPEVLDHRIRETCRSLPLQVIALGSYACGELVASSDLDLFLLGQDSDSEQAAQEFLSRWGNYPAKIDLRLRPNGKKGALAPSMEALCQYAETDLEPWERLAYLRSRPVYPSNSQSPLQSIAIQRLLNLEEYEGLLRVKSRIERENLNAKDVQRDLKLGHGGLSDIHWLVGLTALSTQRVLRCNVPAQLSELQSSGELNAVECNLLLESFELQLRLRRWIDLLGFPSNRMPENPERLAHLADLTGTKDGNELLARFEGLRRATRSIYLESCERIRGSLRR